MASNQSIRVLIADDDFLNCELCQHLLEQLGFQVAGVADSGIQAVDLTVRLRPDVVLMDVSMPGQDGLQAARAIQGQCPTPIVVLTAFESPAILQRASTAGVGAYLVKPAEASALQRAITIALARFEDLRELSRLNRELQLRTQALEEALRRVKTLGGLIPICSHCKRIRDDRGYWEQVESYIQNHSSAVFSHGLCPACTVELYPDLIADLNVPPANATPPKP